MKRWRSFNGTIRGCAAGGLAALALACAQAGSAAPADTAALPLTLAGAGPYYVLDMDAQARRLSASTSLADLRVRNAAGDTMAFAWVEPPLPASAPQHAQARLYKVPLPADAATTVNAMPRQAWIVDTHNGNDDLLNLELALERDTQGVYTLRVEASDDLQHWRRLQEDAPLVLLQALPQVGSAGALATLADRQRPTAGDIDLDNVSARYLRLTTAPRSAIPPLVSASVTRTPHRPTPAPLEWSAAIAPSSCEEASCDYPLPPNTPVAQVQIVPTDVDTIGQVMVLGQVDANRQAVPRRSLLRGSLHALRLKATHSAEKAGLAWDSGAIASVYWLSQASGAPDLHSPPVRLDGATWQALRLETFGPISQLGRAAPTIRIAVRQRQLVFLARGTGPYVLARAKPAETSAPILLSDLMPGRAADAALPSASAAIAPPAPAESAAAASSQAQASAAAGSSWLWAALLAGLALIAALAWSLLRKRPTAAAKQGA